MDSRWNYMESMRECKVLIFGLILTGKPVGLVGRSTGVWVWVGVDISQGCPCQSLTIHATKHFIVIQN
jgi:hypothetical protein